MGAWPSCLATFDWSKQNVNVLIDFGRRRHRLCSCTNIISLFEVIHRSTWEYQQVEGLLTKGAMKADDRPLWFDVYRAFPPVTEPKFAKPKPEIKPIRQILYPEDTVRAKFHSNGHGLGAISMISQTETQTKRLIQQYQKFKSEGVPEDELIEKSAVVVGSERQLEAAKAKVTANKPDSVSAKILADVDIKNIFTEK